MMAAVFFISLQSIAQKETWTHLQTPGVTITGRSGAVTFTIGNKAYVGTGIANGVYLKDLWEYDAVSDIWSQKADFGGIARASAVGFSIGNKGYLGTGFNQAGAYVGEGDFWQYDPSLNVWTQKAGVSFRSDAVGFSINGKGYIATGYDNPFIRADCSEYDPVTNKWSGKAPSPVPRLAGTCFTIGNKAYIGGGYKILFGSVTEPIKDFWEFDPANNTWTQVADFGGSAVIRNWNPSFSLNGKGYISVSGSSSKETWQYDPATNTWNKKAPFPGNLSSIFAFTMGDKAYVSCPASTGSGIDMWTYQISHPANLKALYTGRNYVHLNWDSSASNSGATLYDIYVDGVKKYTTSGSAITADNLLPNTAYTFTVTGRDSSGNTSTASNMVTAKTTDSVSGLSYRYYEGDWNSLPNFNTLTPVTTGTAANIDISMRPTGTNDHFGFVWEGYINIPAPGNYTFETVSDDGSKLYFNSFYNPAATPLVSNDGLHAPYKASGTVNVPAAGLYPISMTFFEKDGGEQMQVYWTGPAGSGITRQLIPAAAFTGNYTPVKDTLAPAAPVHVKVLSAGRNYVGLSWDGAADSTGIAAYDVYVNGMKKYTTGVSNIIADGLAANTLYTFTIKARDLAGNSSGFSDLVTGKTGIVNNGLNYRYYEGSWDSLPDFTALTPVKTGLTPNVDISVRPAGINDRFGFVWEGYINITTPGTYTFETVSDDGSRLYFNSLYDPSAMPTVNNNGLHAPSAASGTVNISAAGVYPISITFFEKDGGEQMQVYWTGPGFTRQLIPNAAFTSPPPPPPPANGLTYKYYEGNWNILPDFDTLAPVKTGMSPNADISVRPAGVNDHFGFVWEGYITIPTPGNYTFETISDDGSRVYFNTLYNAALTPTVNNDGLHAPNAATGTVNIPYAGAYPIAISFFEKDGGEQMQFYWSGPGFSRQPVPDSAFIRPGTDSILSPATVFNPNPMLPGQHEGIIKVYPNPFMESFNVAFFNPAAGNVISVGIYDLTGKLIMENQVGNLSSGNNTVTISVKEKTLLPGMYLVGLKANGKIIKTMKLIKAKQ